jgi:hypothetical protein
MSEDPLPEIVVDGAVYFPGWKENRLATSLDWFRKTDDQDGRYSSSPGYLTTAGSSSCS